MFLLTFHNEKPTEKRRVYLGLTLGTYIEIGLSFLLKKLREIQSLFSVN